MKVRTFAYTSIYTVLMAFLFAAFSLAAKANVSIRNGNFFMGYTDINYSGGMEPKIERVYNSKSSHNGIFGFGWGSDYEVHLKISADGAVIIYENGGGAQNRFVPPAFSKKDVDSGVDQIIVLKAKSGLSGAAKEKERQRILIRL